MNAKTTKTSEIKALKARMSELNSRIGRCPVGQHGRYLEYLKAYSQLEAELASLKSK